MRGVLYPNLRLLMLQDNWLIRVELDTWLTPNLEELNLSFNNLTRLADPGWRPLDPHGNRTTEHSLYIRLDNNPWYCDEELVWIPKFLRFDSRLSVFYSQRPGSYAMYTILGEALCASPTCLYNTSLIDIGELVLLLLMIRVDMSNILTR